MTFIVQDLLDYAQIKAGKFRKNISTFDIRESIEKVMCIQREKANEKGIQFEAKFLNFQRESDDAYVVKTDEHRVMQVLLGLQSNALKFTNSGSVTVIVEIELENG